MADHVVIAVNEVNKSFKLPHEKHSGLKQAALNFGAGKKYETQRVLRDVSFEIKEGEFFGIVGRNGSGKSTLLKILASIYQPSSGAVRVDGKLVPFIELGVGFNPELSGRENVFLNGALLGFNQRETEAMYAGIVEFAELEDFMDQKLKNYSSGMQVRLAFSIAIRAKSDILLIDEVLAVGDEAFQRKCLDVFEKYKAEKQTIVLVTHDMETVRKFCTRAMLISDGEIAEIGNPRAVADRYSQLNQVTIDEDIEKSNALETETKLIKARVLDAALKPATSFALGEKMIVSFDWSALPKQRIESVGVHIFKLSGEHLTGINSRTGMNLKDLRGLTDLAIEFDLSITPGKYYAIIEVFSEPGKVVESLSSGLEFVVMKTDMPWSGLVELPHRWLAGEKGGSNEG